MLQGAAQLYEAGIFADQVPEKPVNNQYGD